MRDNLSRYASFLRESLILYFSFIVFFFGLCRIEGRGGFGLGSYPGFPIFPALLAGLL